MINIIIIIFAFISSFVSNKEYYKGILGEFVGIKTLGILYYGCAIAASMLMALHLLDLLFRISESKIITSVNKIYTSLLAGLIAAYI